MHYILIMIYMQSFTCVCLCLYISNLIQGAEPKDDVKYSTMHMTVHHTKNYLTPKFSSALEKSSRYTQRHTDTHTHTHRVNLLDLLTCVCVCVYVYTCTCVLQSLSSFPYWTKIAMFLKIICSFTNLQYLYSVLNHQPLEV